MPDNKGGGLLAVVSGATDVPVKDWSFTPRAETEDTTNSGSDTNADGVPYRERIFVALEGTVTFTILWDFDAHPTEDPPNINVGEQITVYEYIDAANYFTTTIDITETPIRVHVTTGIEFSCTGLTSGEWTLTTD